MEIIGWIFAALNLFSIGLGMTLLLTADNDRSAWIRIAILSIPVGFVVTSLMFFVWMTGIGTQRTAYLLFETCLAIGFAVPTLRWFSESRPNPPIKSGDSSFTDLVATAFLLMIIGVFVFQGIQAGSSSPLGFWDAWSRINLKASFLSDASTVFEAIGPRVHHPDYPLLLSSAVGRWYLLVGESHPTIPLLISIGGATWLLISLFALLREFHSALTGLAGVAWCLSLDYFWFWSAMQYSDLLLSLFIVIALYSFNRLLLGSTTWLGVYFFSVGAAAWCKNEGIAFALISLAVTTAIVIVPNKQLREKLPDGSIVGGILLAICFLATIGVKIAAPEANDLFLDDSSKLDKLTDWSRYQLVFASFFKFSLGGIYLIPALVSIASMVGNLIADGVTSNRYGWIGLLKILILAIVFFAMYLITPHDLEFHLSRSMDRLILQLWAPLVISILLCFQVKNGQLELSQTELESIGEDERNQSASP